MMKFSLIVVWAVSLWVGTALATPTPQQACDYARITAWKVYTSCLDTNLAKDAKGTFEFSSDEFAAFAKCRHAYFKKWTAFQAKPSLTGSTCIGVRFTDNGTTVTDNLTMLVWEKKTTDGSVHDVTNTYSWSTGSNNEDGTAFTSFLGAVNGGGGFAGANGWRLPTLAELQSIVLDFTCTGAGGGSTCRCGSNPCIDGIFGATQAEYYWSATSYLPLPTGAWNVIFFGGFVYTYGKPGLNHVRAVRGGL